MKGLVQIKFSVEPEFAELHEALATLMRVSRVDGFKQNVLFHAYQHTQGAVRRGIITQEEYDEIMGRSQPVTWRSVYAAHAEMLRLMFQRCPHYTALLFGEQLMTSGYGRQRGAVAGLGGQTGGVREREEKEEAGQEAGMAAVDKPLNIEED